MKKIKLTIALFAIMFAGTAFAQTAQEVQTKFNEAAAAFNAKQFSQSAKLFQEVVDMGQTAEEDVTATVKQANSFLVQSYMNSGKMNAQKKQFDAALAEFKNASKVAGSTADLRNKLMADNMISTVYRVQATEKYKANDFAGAAAIAETALTDNDKDFKNGIFAAQCYSKAGNTAKADELFAKVIALGESNSRYANAGAMAKKAATAENMAVVAEALKAKDYTKALAACEKAAKYSPNTPNVELAKIQILNDSKNYAEIAKVGANAVSIQTNPEAKANAAFFVAIAFQELKNNPKAIEYYKQVTVGANAETAKKLIEQLQKAVQQ